MGRVKTYPPNAKKCNFPIQRGTDAAEYSQMLQLTNYYIPDGEEIAVPGNWLCILCSRRASTRRPREEQAGDEEEEEESKFEDEGDDDDDEDGDDEQEQATPPSRSRMRTGAGSGSGGCGGRFFYK